jgi:hypothetical protein
MFLMNSLATWIIWIVVSLAFNCASAVNRRALQSRSWRWGVWSSFSTGLFYMAGLIGANKILLGSRLTIALAFLIYGVASAIGSVVGQEIVLQFKFFQHLEERKND